MVEEIKEVEMYSYIADGKYLWTSNLMFAEIRATHYGSDKVYVETVSVDSLSK
jgi:hypothetical protein